MGNVFEIYTQILGNYEENRLVISFGIDINHVYCNIIIFII